MTIAPIAPPIGTSTREPARSPFGSVTLLRWVLLAVVGVAVVPFVTYGLAAIIFPFPLDYGEGPLLDQTVRLAAFENIYRADLGEPPYTVSNYPPLYPLMQVPFVWAFGPAFWYGRLLSWLATLGSAVAIGAIVRALTADRRAALAAAAIFLASPVPLHWAPLFRVDSVALALSLAGLALLVCRTADRRAVAASAVLLVLAAFTKQSFLLAAPPAAVVWLWTTRSRAAAVRYAATIAVLGLVPLVLLTVATDGGFLLHVVTANANAYWPHLLVGYTQLVARQTLLLLVGLVLFLVLGRGRLGSWPVLATYGLGAIAAAALVGKVGSNVNYFLELSVAMALAAGAIVAWARRPSRAAVLALVMLTVQAGWFTVKGFQHSGGARDGMRASSAEWLALLDRVRATPGPIVAEDAMGLLPLAGRRVELQPLEMTFLAQAGRWDDGPVVAALERGRYALVVRQLRETDVRWTPGMLDALARSYVAVDTLGPTVVLAPRATALPAR